MGEFSCKTVTLYNQSYSLDPYGKCTGASNDFDNLNFLPNFCQIGQVGAMHCIVLSADFVLKNF